MSNTEGRIKQAWPTVKWLLLSWAWLTAFGVATAVFQWGKIPILLVGFPVAAIFIFRGVFSRPRKGGEPHA